MVGGIVSDKAVASKRPTPIVRDAETLFRRGVEALERNRFEEAVGLLRQAAEMAPQASAVFLALGIALTQVLEISEAEHALETAVALDPEEFFPHLRLAELYLRIGVPTKAQDELRLAMDLSTTAEQRKMVRELLAVDAKRAARRIWRPDFRRFIRKPRR